MPAIVDTLRYVLELDDKGFRATAQSADSVVSDLAGSISSVLTAALAGLAAAFSAVRIGEFIKDATLTAARTEVLGTALTQVGANADVSVGRLAILEEQIKSLGITTQEARLSIIKFIQSGLPLEKVAQLARLAQDSAVVAGINSSEAFERLVRGIQTGQIELIRSAGIFVSIEQALNRFARESGRAREGITDLERQTVILNEVLAQSEKVAGNYEAAMQDVGKQLTSMPRYFEELSNAIGNRFKPLLEAVVPLVEELAKDIEKATTNDIVVLNRQLLAVTGDRAAKLQGIVATENEIARITARIVELTNYMVQASGEKTGNPILAFLTTLKAQTTIPRLTDELNELRKQLAGLAEAAGTGLDIKIATAFQDSGSEKRVAQLDRFLNLQKNVPAPIDLPVKVRMETSDEKLMRELTGQELGPNEISVVVDLNDQDVLDQIEAIRQQVEKKFQKILKPLDDYWEFPGGEMSPIDQNLNRLASLQEGLSEFQQEAFAAFNAIGRIGFSVLSNIGNEAARVFDEIINSIGSFATGDIVGGIAGAISSIFSIFGSSNERLIVSQRDLIRAIESWEQTVFELTDQQRAEQEAAAQRLLATVDSMQARGVNTAGFLNVLRDILTQAGVDVPEGASLQQLVEIANAMLAELGDLTISSEAIRQADTRAEQNALIAQARSFNEAQLLVRTFSELFDLSLEEQQALLQQVFDDLAERGLLSEADRVELITSIEDLADRIAEQSDAGGATQTERSIARITERQADTLVSALSTLDLHLREGFQNLINAFNDWSVEAFGRVTTANAAYAGAQPVTISAINVYAPTGNGATISKTIANTLEKELRAVGGLRLKG